MPRFQTQRVAPQLAPSAMAYAPLLSRGIREGLEARTRKKQWERQQGETERATGVREGQGQAQIELGQAGLARRAEEFDTSMAWTKEAFGRNQEEGRMSREWQAGRDQLGREFQSSENAENRAFQGTQAGLSRAVSREQIAASLMAAQSRGGGSVNVGGVDMPYDDAVRLYAEMGKLAGADFTSMLPPELRAGATRGIQALQPALLGRLGVGQPQPQPQSRGARLMGPMRGGYRPGRAPLFPRE